MQEISKLKIEIYEREVPIKMYSRIRFLFKHKSFKIQNITDR